MSGEAGERILVAYYSVTGNTARVARDIARLTGADLEPLRDPDYGAGFSGYLKAIVDAVCGRAGRIGPLRHTPREYALTVVGTPIWARHMTPAVRAYLKRCGADVRNIAFFVTSGSTDASCIVPAMETLAGRKGIAYTGFTATELADRAVYEAKLAGFVEALRASLHFHGTPDRVVLQAPLGGTST